MDWMAPGVEMAVADLCSNAFAGVVPAAQFY